ncbi:MAG: 2-oxo-4-hydroxy-4-carboxy-5-ureidoimidazoline decarboxylase [Streptosporangiaceae bacterium]
MTGLAEFNDLTDSAARRVLLACCNSAAWADVVASGRPYRSAEDLLAASEQAVAALSQADLAEALAGHPRIGDRALAGASATEQERVTAAGADLRDRLADGNAEYERRFGHIYLACATGRDAASLLAFLRQRLANDPDTEWRVVAGELAKINQIRLRALLDARPPGAGPAGSEISTHVLDAVTGAPASGVVVRLERPGDGEIGRASTSADGRIAGFGVGLVPAGTYRLAFETGPYLAAAHTRADGGGEPFYPEVVVTFAVDGQRPRYHVPLLLAPYSYTTYRGS